MLTGLPGTRASPGAGGDTFPLTMRREMLPQVECVIAASIAPARKHDTQDGHADVAYRFSRRSCLRRMLLPLAMAMMKCKTCPEPVLRIARKVHGLRVRANQERAL
ncbi:hypothetical protein DEG02_019420 [Xanthomonas vasicola]|nr:hypothetical protein KWM_0115010 [Xanthomonas vasicola pv. musacearum NCPPB 2005]KFA14099.1 hypothetical protein KWQ_0104955 [Xanthomonas vasicola pv. musacearum NCPPB 4380]KFA19731.1 hypothetical protein A11G_0106955 [Xanthomonas vasicola pv. musacearum NCPPB 4392]KFA23451.1 hypothetical protein KWU_0107320 [Xanthomonas vasicola pv. musacearum NCPPB 4394]KFA38622.1 hypothetical protein KWS_0108385 [Xanthomonas vasicola pv. musacearum NCPPB 4384]RJL85733.1 hypothetical protein DEF95_020040 